MQKNLRYEYINTALNKTFQQLFIDYFKGFNMAFPIKAFMTMDQDIKAHNIQIILLYLKRNPIGFSMFQIDTKENPWCLHEGAGGIREFYVALKYRNQAYGRYLFNLTKQYFIRRNITEIYLTCDDVGDFWKKLGFVATGRIIKENDSEEYKLAL